MKVLALSLLRVGDFFQLAPSFVGRASTGEKINVLVNSQYRFLAQMYPQLQFHWFPRELLQSILVRPDCSTLTGVQILADFCDLLNRQGFDRIENWTNNFLSARLMDLLEASDKRGVHYQGGQVSSQDPELSYFNEVWTRDSKPAKIQVDALHEALSVDWPVLAQEESRNDSFQAPVLLQVTTSDDKKNWPLLRWMQLFQSLAVVVPTKVICAPVEKDMLCRSGFFREQDLLSCSFAEARVALARARLLISGDTSLLHLAVETRTPILGIFLGPANPFKTAPRLAGARLLWGKVACSPCAPRGDCIRTSHMCAEQLDLGTVLTEVVDKLQLGEMLNVTTKADRRCEIFEVIESFDGAARVVPIMSAMGNVKKSMKQGGA